MNNLELSVQFFAQLVVILLACRVVGVIAARFGQPQVVAEMIAGVMLGPSLFGLLAPDWQQYVFPWDATQQTRDTQSYLYPASQLGLALYMFTVGMEFRVDVLRMYYRASIAVSIAGMLAPFVLGALLAVALHRYTELFGERTSLVEAMLFLGASMCITAFPMLARIIHFNDLAGTRMGTVALGAGAIDDAVAWGLLAVVLASFDQDIGTAVWSILGGVTYVTAVVLVARPLFRLALPWWLDEKQQLTETGTVVAIAAMAAGAFATDLIGLHAVFGAFIMGTAIPRPLMTEGLVRRIEPLTVVLLLPLFFTYSGLNTRIGLLNSGWLWGLGLIVLLAAIVGKGVACWGAARACGLGNREAVGIGALMNARGLMELIIINIGLQRGILSAELFAMLVLMAIITTLVATPVFDLLGLRPEVLAEPHESSGDPAPEKETALV